MALRCKRSFSAYANGTPRVVRAGQLVAEDDPIVRGREDAFESVDEHLADRQAARQGAGHVEQATSDPGQPRDLTPATETTSARGTKPSGGRGRRPAK